MVWNQLHNMWSFCFCLPAHSCFALVDSIISIFLICHCHAMQIAHVKDRQKKKKMVMSRFCNNGKTNNLASHHQMENDHSTCSHASHSQCNEKESDKSDGAICWIHQKCQCHNPFFLLPFISFLTRHTVSPAVFSVFFFFYTLGNIYALRIEKIIQQFLLQHFCNLYMSMLLLQKRNLRVTCVHIPNLKALHTHVLYISFHFHYALFGRPSGRRI